MARVLHYRSRLCDKRCLLAKSVSSLTPQPSLPPVTSIHQQLMLQRWKWQCTPLLYHRLLLTPDTAGSNTPVSIAEAIANATSNAATLHSHHRQKFQASSHTTYRDIAATFTYDQNPSNGGVGNEDAAMRGEAGVGSNE